MMDMIDATNEVRDATRAEVIEWATATYWDMALRGKRILRNAWRKTDYDWFPGAPDLGGDDDGNDHDDDNNDDDDGDLSWECRMSLSPILGRQCRVR
jgi:hypothetical protein